MNGIPRWFPGSGAPPKAELNTQVAPTTGQTIRLNAQQLNNAKPLQVAPGDRIEVSLHQGPSVLNGYRWVPYGALGKPNLRYTPDDRSPHALDPGITTTFTFTVPPNANKRVSLRFDEARPWEAGEKPISSFSLNLVVAPR
jgi:hypothetical protein